MPNEFDTRSLELERLDRGEYTAQEYERWQREMFFIHRLLGEQRAIRAAIRPIIGKGCLEGLKVLEVGAGSGDMLAGVRRWMDDTAGLFVGADANVISAKSIRNRGSDAVQCDGLKLPFRDGSFDIVYCSLTLHHFDDDGAQALLKEMRRVAIQKVIVVDLRRSLAAYRLYRFLGRPLLQRFTYEDGSLSIKRAFTESELKRLAGSAGFSTIEVFRSAAFRLVLRGI